MYIYHGYNYMFWTDQRVTDDDDAASNVKAQQG
jgi:hypothetical protein